MFNIIYFIGVTFVVLNLVLPIAITDCYHSIMYREPKRVSAFEFYVWRLITLLVIGMRMKYSENSKTYVISARTEGGYVTVMELIY